MVYFVLANAERTANKNIEYENDKDVHSSSSTVCGVLVTPHSSSSPNFISDSGQKRVSLYAGPFFFDLCKRVDVRVRIAIVELSTSDIDGDIHYSDDVVRPISRSSIFPLLICTRPRFLVGNAGKRV